MYLYARNPLQSSGLQVLAFDTSIMNEPQPQPTIPQPLPGFCIWRDERLPVLQVEFPDLSLEHLRARLKQEWGAMNGAQQS